MTLEERQFRVFKWGMAAIAVWSLIYLAVMLYYADRLMWIAFAAAAVYSLLVWGPIFRTICVAGKIEGKEKRTFRSAPPRSAKVQ